MHWVAEYSSSNKVWGKDIILQSQSIKIPIKITNYSVSPRAFVKSCGASKITATPVGQSKKDPYQELERLGSLKQQGVISEEEFQKLKMRLLTGI